MSNSQLELYNVHDTVSILFDVKNFREDAFYTTYFISGSTAARWSSMEIFFTFNWTSTASATASASAGAIWSSSSFQIAHATCIWTSTATCL